MNERIEARTGEAFSRRRVLMTLVMGAGGLFLASALPEIANSAPSDPSRSPGSSRFPGLDRLSAFLTGITKGVEMRVGSTTPPYTTENGVGIGWQNGVPGDGQPNPSTRGYGQVTEGNLIWQVDSTLQYNGVNLYRDNSDVSVGGVASGKKTDNSEVAIYATADSLNGAGYIRVQGKNVGDGSQFGFPTDGLIPTEFTSNPIQGLEVNEASSQKYVVLTYTGGVKKYIKLDSNLRASESSWTDSPPVVDPTATPTPTRIPPTATPTPAVCKAPTGSFKAKQDKEDLDMTITIKGKAGGKPPVCGIAGAELDITRPLGPNGSPPYSPSLYRSDGYPSVRYTPDSPGIYNAKIVVIGSDGKRSVPNSANFTVKPPKVSR